jgi:PAS domain-containing protein
LLCERRAYFQPVFSGTAPCGCHFATTLAKAFSNVKNDVIRHRSVIFDMTQARQNAMTQRIAVTTSDSLSGRFATDPDGLILQVNNAFSSLTGYSEQEVLGQWPHLLSSGI